jgi:hypothetical protein
LYEIRAIEIIVFHNYEHKEKDMKSISSTQHGYLDYLTVVVFLASPALIGMTGMAGIIAYALAGIHLAMTLITDFPLGAAKLLPFKVHGWVERVIGPVLILLPFGFGFDAPARVFYIVIGVVIILVGLLTNYQKSKQV